VYVVSLPGKKKAKKGGGGNGGSSNSNGVFLTGGRQEGGEQKASMAKGGKNHQARCTEKSVGEGKIKGTVQKEGPA